MFQEHVLTCDAHDYTTHDFLNVWDRLALLRRCVTKRDVYRCILHAHLYNECAVNHCRFDLNLSRYPGFYPESKTPEAEVTEYLEIQNNLGFTNE